MREGMRELHDDQYSRTRALVGAVPFNSLFARAVLEKKVRGRVLVDNEADPSVCLVVHKYGMSLLCGDPENRTFNRELKEFLQNDARNGNSAKWLVCFPNAWEGALRTLLGGDLVEEMGRTQGFASTERPSPAVLRTERLNFKFDGKPSTAPEVPADFVVRRIDSNLYDKIQGTVVPQYFWNSSQEFLAEGIGFSLLAGDQVVSTAFSSFVVEDQLELGVETHPDFRRRGLASFPASALVDYCLSHGYEPVWACRKGNIPSFRLAIRLGFSPSTVLPYYILPAGREIVQS